MERIRLSKHFIDVYEIVKAKYQSYTDQELQQAYQNPIEQDDVVAFFICDNVGVFGNQLKGLDFSRLIDSDTPTEVLLETIPSVFKLYNGSTKLITYAGAAYRTNLLWHLRYVNSSKGKSKTGRVEKSLDEIVTEDGEKDIYHIVGTDSIAHGWVEAQEILEELLQELNLSERELQIFNLICEGYNHREISEIIGLSKSHTNRLCVKVRKMLKEAIGGEKG